MWRWKNKLPKDEETFEIKGKHYKATSYLSDWVRIYEIENKAKEIGELHITTKRFFLLGDESWKIDFAKMTCVWEEDNSNKPTNRQWLSTLTNKELAKWMINWVKSYYNPDEGWERWLDDDYVPGEYKVP